jgi:hypothetical protein
MTAVMEPAPARAAASPVGRWLREGARVLFFRRPELGGLVTSPALLAGLFGLVYLVVFVGQRAVLQGEPTLRWMGLLGGWAGVGVNAWLCWFVATRARIESRPAVDGAALFTLLCAIGIVDGIVQSVVYVPISRWGMHVEDWPPTAMWASFLASAAWIGAAHVRLFWRLVARPATRAVVVLMVMLALALAGWLNPVRFWWPEQKHETAAEAPAQLVLTQDVMEAQPRLLAAALDSLEPPRPGVVDVYAITYAPYASEDVFMRESAVVAGTMARRFGAGGRTVQLVDNPATARTLPWATPLNLQRTIQRMAARMDRDEDVLFIHLTSHGGADGELATDFWPLEIDPVHPAELRRWLDDAGVRWRVISVSACYSGSWIAPLAGDGTLVMTAADAQHTSYGCGSKSPLTFFGQAMYVDALRSTWSFEKAHAQARVLIEQREREAGKTGGYSNPQISVGEAIRARLLRLQAERASADAAAGASAPVNAKALSASRPSRPRPTPGR